MPVKDVLLALLVVAIWGFNFVVIKVGVSEVPPLFLSGLRFVFAALPAVFFIARPKCDWKLVVAFGLVLGVVKFGLLFVGIAEGMPAGLSSLVLQLQAFFTIGLAILIFKDRLSPRQALGALIAFVGIAIIASQKMDGGALSPLLLVIAAAFFWGVANIIAKRAGKIDMLSFIVWASLVPPLPLFALSWWREDHDAIIRMITEPSLISIGAVAYIAYPTTILGFAIWNWLLSRHPTASVAPFTLLVPIFGFASGAIFLGEPFSAPVLLGSLCVFAGLMVNVFGDQIARAVAGVVQGRSDPTA